MNTDSDAAQSKHYMHAIPVCVMESFTFGCR